MRVFKFSYKDGKLSLENYNLKNISSDPRSCLINTESVMKDNFKIVNNIFIAEHDLFFSLSKKFTKDNIDSMVLEKNNCKILFVPSKTCIYFNGKPVDVEKFPLPENFEKLLKLIE